MSIYLNINTKDKLNIKIFEIYAKNNNLKITKTNKKEDIKNNIFVSSCVPSFGFNKNNYKKVRQKFVKQEHFAGSFLMEIKGGIKLEKIKDWLTTWSIINYIKNIYFNNYLHSIINFDGRQKDKNYKIADLLDILHPKLYFVSDDIYNVFSFIVSNKTSNFVLKPNYLDTGKGVYINPDKKEFSQIYSEYTNLSISDKELLPLLKENMKKYMVEELIHNPINVKVYVFCGQIKFIMIEGDMFSDALEQYCMESFKNGIFKIIGKGELRYLNEIKENSLKLFDLYHKNFNGNIMTNFLRVDFLVSYSGCYFNEFCLFPNGGKARSFNEIMDKKWGIFFSILS